MNHKQQVDLYIKIVDELYSLRFQDYMCDKNSDVQLINFGYHHDYEDCDGCKIYRSTDIEATALLPDGTKITIEQTIYNTDAINFVVDTLDRIQWTGLECNKRKFIIS